jgi:hypothetical protein
MKFLAARYLKPFGNLMTFNERTFTFECAICSLYLQWTLSYVLLS